MWGVLAMMTQSVSVLNDETRMTLSNGLVILAEGVRQLSDDHKTQVIKKVRNYDDFSDKTDPDGDHSCGSFKLVDIPEVSWKIEYYGPDMITASDDPSDRSKTRRVLKIMLTKEQ
jgi:hypothetical protein